MDTAAPVGQVVVRQSVNDRGGGDNVHGIVAVELAADLERAEVGKSIDIGDRNLVVVLGEGEVQTRLLLAGGALGGYREIDAVVN